MIFRNCGFTPPSSPSLVYETRKQVVRDLKEGQLVARDVKIEYKETCLNSLSYLSTMLEYDTDKLQKDILCGVTLQNVNTKIMNPDHLDDIDLSKVASSYDSSISSMQETETDSTNS